jgi:hypothetical protein
VFLVGPNVCILVSSVLFLEIVEVCVVVEIVLLLLSKLLAHLFSSPF